MKMRLHSSPGILYNIIWIHPSTAQIHIGNLSNSIPGKMREFDREKGFIVDVQKAAYSSSYLHFLRDIFRIYVRHNMHIEYNK